MKSRSSRTTEDGPRIATAPRARALLVVSAHWEESAPTVMTAVHPPMLYDYTAFTPASYEITWPAPGDPQLAREVQDLLAAAASKQALIRLAASITARFVP
jgi:aromatic ring-opening dioxygenase catalytic subunit (LigB family)